MTERDYLAEQFEANRGHLRAVAYRMLGSLSEADDAVQESWLRLSRSDADGIENLTAWLTTVVARVCLDMLRSRKARREEPLDGVGPEPVAPRRGEANPEEEAVLADSVGLALLVVLETLAPAERLAFVLHDMFAVPFAEIAPIVGRTPIATRQLASRARRRVHGAGGRGDGAGRERRVSDLPAKLQEQRTVVDAFLAAARAGDFAGLLAVLDPDVVLRTDPALLRPGIPAELRGAAAVAEQAVKGGARAAQPALVNGAVALIVAPRGQLMLVIDFTVENGKIVAIESIADPERLDRLELAVLD